LEILCFDTLDSTQIYLLEELKNKKLNLPVCVTAKEQIAGIGSRENSWEGGEGNLFFSFAVSLDDLPKDLPLSSASIYFSYIMREVIFNYESTIWLKWPNDLYQDAYKIGGTITKKIDNIFLCGMGINLQKNSNGFKALNLNVKPIILLEEYLDALEKYPTWKQIFSQYRIEFERSREFFTHIDGDKKPLKNAIL
jgi:BirA family biotin operon repressor/biotin-[acetyl-CoA-carboxylase] ligase